MANRLRRGYGSVGSHADALIGHFAAGEPEIGFRHDPDEFFEFQFWFPAELALPFGGVADLNMHLAWSPLSVIGFYIFSPVQ